MNSVLRQLEGLRSFQASGQARPYAFRAAQLKALEQALRRHESEILGALHEDLRKPAWEALAGELEPLYSEIRIHRQNLKKWMEPRAVPTPALSVAHWGASSWIVPEPRGLCLLISPWNYPIYLTLVPLVSAIAAGNSSVVKVSEMAPASAKVLVKILSETFSPEYVLPVEGGAEETQMYLKEPFDFIFYTGGGRVGREIMKAASQHLTPVVLELGGKSPAVIHRTASVKTSVKRLLWGKCFNAGQTCVAPDYALVDEVIWTEFLEECRVFLERHYSKSQGDDYARIIHEKHFDRLQSLLAGQKIFWGGDHDRADRWFSPTIVLEPPEDSPILQEEIFGPILPVLKFRSDEEAIERIRKAPKPLAFYLFSNDRKRQSKFIREVSAGGIMINDCLVHLTNPHLPFGGVGPSGMGRYHGHYGFEAFSHLKAVEVKSSFPDFSLRYPPYIRNIRRIVRKFF